MSETKRHLTHDEKRELVERALDTTNRLLQLALRRELATFGSDACFACVLKTITVGMISCIASDVAFLSQGDNTEAADFIALFTQQVAAATIELEQSPASAALTRH